jgi:hypothetical protein
LNQNDKQEEHIADAVVKGRVLVSFKGILQQLLKIQVGDVLWFYRNRDGDIIVKKAPENVQAFAKGKPAEDR